MKLKVYRYDPSTRESRYDSFEFEPPAGMTVLSALFHVQDRFDDSLSFRYSCRGAVCGSCAMLINKAPRLACRTQVSALLEGKAEVQLKPYEAIEDGESFDPATEVLVEPLSHLPVLKDLVVNMARFFDSYRKVEPVLKPGHDKWENESLMEPARVKELEDYTNCILCASCFGACPVDGKHPGYFGPAALAKLYRFHIDPRDTEGNERLLRGHEPNGWWGCEFHTNCRTVCPRGVPPNVAIGKARAKLKKLGKKPPSGITHD